MSDAPAARVGDAHTCLAHGAGPVVAPAAQHVEITGFLAARTLDLAQCGAPFDWIALGEPTVLIEGAPAARKGDLTLHGGQIDVGSPDVMIGAPLTGKARRMAWRKALIAYAQANSQDASTLKAASDLKLFNVAVEHARLAMATYEFARQPGFEAYAPEGWSRQQEWSDANGFHAELYRSDIDGSYVLAFRGTDTLQELQTLNSPDNSSGNLPQAVGVNAPQYEMARALALEIGALYPGNLTVTGHSLGGGLASLASLVAAAPGYTFDPAGLHPVTATGNDVNGAPLDINNAAALINALFLEGEALTSLEQGRIAPFLPNLLPDAAGTTTSVPLTPDQQRDPALAGDATPGDPNDGNWFQNNVLTPLAQSGQRHGIWYLIDAIEHQKSLLIDKLCADLGVPPLPPEP